MSRGDRDAKYDYVIFSMGGFTDELLSAAKERNVLLLTLDDIYRKSSKNTPSDKVFKSQV